MDTGPRLEEGNQVCHVAALDLGAVGLRGLQSVDVVLLPVEDIREEVATAD